MEPNTIFAKGEIYDRPGELDMANTNKKLRWVAVRGGIHDWAIYCHFAGRDWEWIRRYGDKVLMESDIKSLVPCDDEAFKMYRYQHLQPVSWFWYVEGHQPLCYGAVFYPFSCISLTTLIVECGVNVR
jgi:hypothetical protein